MPLAASGLDGLVVYNASVTVTDFTANDPMDVDMLVEAPDKRAALVYSDNGGANCTIHHPFPILLLCTDHPPADHLTLTFTDFPPPPVFGVHWPYGPLVSGSYRPFDVDDLASGAAPFDFFPPPAAGGRKTFTMNALNGAPANGVWKLFVRNDDPPADGLPGSIGQWSVTIQPGIPEPIDIAPAADITTNDTPGLCTAPVTFETPFVKGSPSPTVTVVPPAGHLFPAGVTAVEITASNIFGTMIRTFNVTVNDTEAPTLQQPADIVLDNEPDPLGTIVHYSFATNDNCAGVIVESNPPSGSRFQVGLTQVTAVARDAQGNVSAPVQFFVAIEDHTAPVVTYVATPAITGAWAREDVTVEVFATDPGGSGIFDVGCRQDLLPTVFGPSPLTTTVSKDGETTVRCSVFDVVGNRTVLVLPPIRIDRTPPQITVVRSQAPNANGWNNTDLQLHFDVSEPHSGIADSDPTDYNFTQEASNQNLLFYTSDHAGNCAAVIFGDGFVNRCVRSSSSRRSRSIRRRHPCRCSARRPTATAGTTPTSPCGHRDGPGIGYRWRLGIGTGVHG